MVNADADGRQAELDGEIGLEATLDAVEVDAVAAIGRGEFDTVVGRIHRRVDPRIDQRVTSTVMCMPSLLAMGHSGYSG